MKLKHRFLILLLTFVVTCNMCVTSVKALDPNLPSQFDKDKLAITTAVLGYTGLIITSGSQAYHSAQNLYDKFKNKISEVGDNYVIKPDADLIDSINTNIPTINQNISVNPIYRFASGDPSISYKSSTAFYIFYTSSDSMGYYTIDADVIAYNKSDGSLAWQSNNVIDDAYCNANGLTMHAIRLYPSDSSGSTYTYGAISHYDGATYIFDFVTDSKSGLYVPKLQKNSICLLDTKHSYSSSYDYFIHLNSIKFKSDATGQILSFTPSVITEVSQVELPVAPSPIDVAPFNADALKSHLAETPVSIVIPKNTIPNIDISSPDPIVVPNTVVDKDINTVEDLPTPTEPETPTTPSINYTSILTDILNAIKAIPQFILDLPIKIYDFFKNILQDILDAIKAIPDLIRELPQKLIDLLKNLLKEIFIPGDQFIKDNFDQLKNDISIKYSNDLNILDSLKVDAEEFTDVKVNLYGKEMTILSAQPIRDNIVWIRMVTSMFFIFLLLVYVYNQIYFLIRGTYPIVTSSKTTISGGE